MAFTIAAQRKALPALLLIFAALLLTVSISRAMVECEDLLEDEVDGLILRKTLTRTGHEFFNQFSRQLGDTGDIGGYNIVVNEKFLPQIGGFIWVEVNDTVVFQTLLQRNRDISEEVDRAVQAVNDFILQTYFENGGHLEGLESSQQEY